MLEAGGVLDLLRQVLHGADDVFSVIFFLVLVFTFFDGSGRRQKKSSGTLDSTEGFNTLPLEDGSEVEVRKEVVVPSSDRIAPRGVSNDVTEKYRRRYQQQRRTAEKRIERESEARASEQRTEEPTILTAEDARDAFILSEIFDKPKSLRRR